MYSNGFLKGSSYALTVLSYLSIAVIVVGAFRYKDSDTLGGLIISVLIIILGIFLFLCFGCGAHTCIVKYRRRSGDERGKGGMFVYVVTFIQYVITSVVFPFL